MAAEDLVRKLWSRVPQINCKGLCYDSCGPVMPGPEEAKVIRTRHAVEVTWDPDTHVCVLLDDDHRCTIYEDRPLLCRLWGAIPELPCPHGCEGSDLTTEGAQALMRGIYGQDRSRWPRPKLT